MILEDIVAAKAIQLQIDKQHMSLDAMKYMLKHIPHYPHCSFKEALKRDGMSIIAEVKKASPSKGVISHDFEPLQMARLYQEGMADAISVLTERRFFQGSDEYLSMIKKAVSVPVLRKDFIIDIWQIYHSRLLGADAILLIAAILDKPVLQRFYVIASMLGMDCLVEVHDERELEAALDIGAEIIGINNRNLKDFSIDLRTTEKLIKYIPHDKIVVAESGIKDAMDAAYMASLGVDALLVGEVLMRSHCPGNVIKQFKEAAQKRVI